MGKVVRLLGIALLVFTIVLLNVWDRTFIAWPLISVVAVAAVGWRLWSKRFFAARNTHTESIAAAVDGYVELYGRTEPGNEGVLRDPIDNKPCVWFAIKSFPGNIAVPGDLESTDSEIKTFGRRIRYFKEARSSRVFVLRDASGCCVIDPRAAQFDLTPDNTTYDELADATHVIWRIGVGAVISTWGSYEVRDSQLSGLTISATEQDGSVNSLGRLGKPKDSRPYVISTKHAAKFERAAAEKSLTHFAILVLVAAGLLIAAYVIYGVMPVAP